MVGERDLHRAVVEQFGVAVAAEFIHLVASAPVEEDHRWAVADNEAGLQSPVHLDVYQGARHAFDAPEFKTGVEAYGHRVEYNAAEKSVSDVRAFLKQAFGG